MAAELITAMLELPPELQVQIFRYTPPLHIVEILMGEPRAMAQLIGWDFSFFDIEQLLHLCKLSAIYSDLVGITGSKRKDPTLKIIYRINEHFRQMLEASKESSHLASQLRQNGKLPRLPLEACTLEYHRINFLFDGNTKPSKQEILKFAQDFCRRQEEIRDFCTEIADLAEYRKLDRALDCEIVDETYLAHNLVFLAMEFITAAQATLTADGITKRWHDFHAHIKEVFGRKANRLLNQTVSGNGTILDMYQELVEDYFWNKHHEVLESLASKNEDIAMKTYGIYIISHGPSRALALLRELKKRHRTYPEMTFVSKTSRSQLYAWQEAWDRLYTNELEDPPSSYFPQ